MPVRVLGLSGTALSQGSVYGQHAPVWLAPGGSARRRQPAGAAHGTVQPDSRCASQAHDTVKMRLMHQGATL